MKGKKTPNFLIGSFLSHSYRLPLVTGFVFGVVLSSLAIFSKRNISEVDFKKYDIVEPELLVQDFRSLDDQCPIKNFTLVKPGYFFGGQKPLPTHYRILCGQSGVLWRPECYEGSFAFKNFTGDIGFRLVKIGGRSAVKRFENHCDPLTGSMREGKKFSYIFPIQNGKYAVILFLSEMSPSEGKKRFMDVKINGNAVLKNFSVLNHTGALNSVHLAILPEILVERKFFHIEFFGLKNQKAFCNAIKVIPVGEYLKRRLFVPNHTVCSTGKDSSIQIQGERKDALNVSLLATFPGNVSVFQFHPNYTGHYNITEVSGGSKRVVYSGEIEAEDCRCPLKFVEFQKRYFCPKLYTDRIVPLFKTWEKDQIPEKEFHNSTVQGRSDVVHCSVISNELFCSPNSRDIGAWESFQTLVLAVLKVARISDLEFYWHGVKKPLFKASALKIPVFGPKYSLGFTEIPVPSQEVIEFSLSGKMYETAASFPSFEEKEQKALLVMKKDKKKKFSPLLRKVSEAHTLMSNGSLIFTDKNASSDPLELLSRLAEFKMVFYLNPVKSIVPKHIALVTGTALVEQKSTAEWYDLFLGPNQHIIRMGTKAAQISQTVQKGFNELGWLEGIGKEATVFALEHFSQEAMLCWTGFLLEKMSQLLAFQPEVRSNMTLVSPKLPVCTGCTWSGF